MTTSLNRAATLAENVISTAFRPPPLFRHGVLRRRAVDAAAREVVTRFDVRGVPARGPVATLSGGNLQKIVGSRELSGDPALVVANQHTRGLDVGSMEFVHGALRAQRDRGLATLLVSSELDEVLDLADRVAVLYDGRLAGPFPRADVDRERIGALMAGNRDRDGRQEEIG